MPCICRVRGWPLGVGPHCALWVLGSSPSWTGSEYLFHQAFSSYCLVSQHSREAINTKGDLFIICWQYIYLRILYYFYLFGWFCFPDRVSLSSPGYPGTHSCRPGVKLRDPSASACRVLGLKRCATPLHLAKFCILIFLIIFYM